MALLVLLNLIWMVILKRKIYLIYYYLHIKMNYLILIKRKLIL